MKRSVVILNSAFLTAASVVFYSVSAELRPMIAGITLFFYYIYLINRFFSVYRDRAADYFSSLIKVKIYPNGPRGTWTTRGHGSLFQKLLVMSADLFVLISATLGPITIAGSVMMLLL